MKALRSVLVGIDYSEPSDNALREAARIAAWDGADLVALNVLDENILDRARCEIDLPVESVLAEAERRVKRHVEEILGPGHAGVRSQFVLGHPFKAMVAVAEQIDADLIVLGSHGIIHDDEPYRVGTLATRCIRKAKPNVLIVRDWQDGPFEKVCACIDFSEPSRDAAKAALHIAQQDEAKLDFLHVHLPLRSLATHPGLGLGGMPVYSAEEDAEVLKQIQAKLASFADEVAEGCPHVSHVYSEFSLRRGIVDYLKASSPDLVVINTRGHTQIRNLLIGSAAEKIIHEADCSTLVIKPDGFRYELD